MHPGPLKRDTRLLGVAAGRLLLARGNTLEVVLYTQAWKIRGLRLADGRDVVFSHVLSLVAAQLEPFGLFFAYNIPKSRRVAFIPFTAVTALH